MNRSLSFRRASLLVVTAVILFFTWSASIDDAARFQVRDDLGRAAKVFAAARALGSGLSVVQSANVDAKVFGTGVGFSPGQALQPVQEFVDRFAALMLAASVAFGIQLLLLEVGAHWVVSGLLSATMVTAVVVLWRKDARPARVLQALVVFLLLVRFAVPLSVAANGVVYKAVMAPEYKSAVTSLEMSPAFKLSGSGTEESLVARVKAWLQRMSDVPGAIEALLKSAGDWADKMIRLSALFVVQTIVLPLGFLWIFLRICRLTMHALAPAGAVAKQ